MSDTDPNPENPIDNIDDMNRQESAEGDGDADRGADDIPSLNLYEMLSDSCPTTNSAGPRGDDIDWLEDEIADEVGQMCSAFCNIFSLG